MSVSYSKQIFKTFVIQLKKGVYFSNALTNEL